MRTTRRIQAGVLCLALLAAACAEGDDDASEGFTVGVDYNILAVPFIGAVQSGMREVAGELGVTLVERDAGGDVTQQAADIQEFITLEVDGIIVAGLGEANTLGALRPAIAADLPIVTMVSKAGEQDEVIPQPAPEPPAGGIVAFVAQTEELAAELAAEMMIEVLPEGGRYAIVLGAPGFSENTTRVKDFERVLAETGNTYTKVAEQPGNWVPEGGQAACQNLLASNPDIEVFYALSDDMGVGCGKAIQQAGADAKVIGVGGAGVGLDAIRNGTMHGTIWYSPETIGRLAMRTLYDYLTGQAPSNRYVTYDIFKVTADNVDDFEGEW